MHKQLLLFHNATSAYFAGNQQQLEQTLIQFNVKLKPPGSDKPSWLEEQWWARRLELIDRYSYTLISGKCDFVVRWTRKGILKEGIVVVAETFFCKVFQYHLWDEKKRTFLVLFSYFLWLWQSFPCVSFIYAHTRGVVWEFALSSFAHALLFTVFTLK